MWRGGSRVGLSVAAPFVWRCPSTLAIAPFPHPAHRTGHADLPHPALGQELHAFTLAKLCRRARSGVRARSARTGRERIAPALRRRPCACGAATDATAQRCSASSARYARLFVPNSEVVRPAAQRAIQLLHQLRGLLPRQRRCRQRMDLLDHAPDALLRRPHARGVLARLRRVQPPERVAQEIERALPAPNRSVSSPR